MAEQPTYYARIAGQVYGPYDTANLREIARQGQLTATDELSRDQLTWTPAGRYKGLLPDAAAPAAQPAVAALGPGYYYDQNGRTSGPVTMAVLQQLAHGGTLRPGDLVWADGDATSSTAHDVPALAAAFAPVAYGTVGQPLSYSTPYGAGYVYAGFWRRVAAYIIDAICTGVIGGIVGFPLGLAMGYAMGGSGASRGDVAAATQAIGQLLGLVIGWLWWASFECSAARATPGKMALGIVVVDLTGQRIRFGQASGRFFGKIVSGIILGIGFMMAGWTEKKQALHDQMAGTLVVLK
jgi:uncharacterized RDD family membrane protein YckC